MATTGTRPNPLAASALAWALVFFVAGVAVAQIGPLRLDGVAATVGGRSPGPGVEVILRSDVELRADLKLLGRGVRRRKHVPLPEPLLRATLQELIGEHLIEKEASRIRAAPPRRRDVEAELRRLYEASGGQPAVDALLQVRGADPAELRVIARRRAVVGAFLRSNLEGTTVVTEADIDAALAKAQREDPTALLPSREVVRRRLRLEARNESIAHWVTVLRGRITVRVYAQYDAG